MASSSASHDESTLPPSGEPFAATSAEPSLGASIANSPLFKLPPEIRNRIYGYVFGGEGVILPEIGSSARAGRANQWDIEDYDIDDDWYPGPNPVLAVQTSILSVCQIVKAEAIEVLYDSKILRGWPVDLDVMLESHEVHSRVRRIEITGLLDFINSKNPDGHARHLRDLLEKLQCLPRLRSILILSDCLASQLYRIEDDWTTVMDFVRGAGLGPATCIDIGRYQLHNMFENVQIVNKRLVEMWPAVRDTPEDYDGVEDAAATIEGLQSYISVPNVAAWASHMSLRCWTDIQQRFLTLRLSGEWDRLRHKAYTGDFEDDNNYTDDEFKWAFFRHAALNPVRIHMHEFPLLRSGEHVLKRLQPNDDSDVLDEASQFLAVNLVAYNHRNDYPLSDSQWDRRPIVWKTEGKGMKKTSLEYMAEQQSIVLAGGASKEYVFDPSHEHGDLACSLIERKLFMNWIRALDRRPRMDATGPYTATALQTKQLTYLHLAVLQPLAEDNADQHRRDDWTRSLLERYLMAYGRLSAVAVSRTSVADLRMVMLVALDAFDADRDRTWSRSFFDDSALPLDFDNDLYPGLAWGYGKLLAQAFERYASQGRISKTLAQQWVKMSTMWS